MKATPERTNDTDARLIHALEHYQRELDSGRRPARQQFLEEYADVAKDLAACLDGLYLVNEGRPRASSREPLEATGLFGHADGSLPATPLGDFQIGREIGRGGMGVVYEAVQLSLGRRVALKVLPFAAALDPKQLQRFKNEAQAAASLHHPNIVPVYAVGCERSVHYYAMQFIDGQSLAALLAEMRLQRQDERKHELPEVSSAGKRSTLVALTTERAHDTRGYHRRIATLGVQAAQALEYAHQIGVVHRDIKPGNLLLDQQGVLWIADFGLALGHADTGLTRSGELLGTLRYMSPEQALGQRSLVDHRTDIYSLGVTLYELLTLEPVFTGEDRHELLHQIGQTDPRSPRTLDPTLPVELETILLKTLAKHPSERYASAQELAEDLERFLNDRPILARRPSLVDRARKWSRRHPSIVGSAVVMLLLCVAALLISNRLIANEQAKTARQAEEAHQRFQLARRAADEMIQMAEEELSDNPFQEGLRKRLLVAALEYYQEFIAQHGNDPDVQAELAHTRDRVQKILGDLAVLQADRHLFLLREAAVLDDLRVTPEQRTRVNELTQRLFGRREDHLRELRHVRLNQGSERALEAARANEVAVQAILTKEQLNRLRQIALQCQGPMGFREPEVARELKLTPEQKERIRTIEAETLSIRWNTERGTPKPTENHEKRLRASMDKIRQVLTPTQAQRWQELAGEPFPGPLPMVIFGPFPPPGPQRPPPPR